MSITTIFISIVTILASIEQVNTPLVSRFNTLGFFRAECSEKGGVKIGSCASGFGVCCAFTLTCGSKTSENTSYFEVSDASDGDCIARVCKVSERVCQV